MPNRRTVRFLEESNTSEERLKVLEQTIDALKETVEIHRNSAQKYSSLFNNTSDGIWINDLSGVIVEVNEAYSRMSGYSKEEIIGKHISKFECIDSPQEIANHIKKVLEMGGHDRFESQHCRKDGSTYDVDITALYLPEQQSGQMAIFIRDITGRKSAERALRYSEERFRLVAEAAKVLVYEFDVEQGTIVIFQGEGAIGYSKGEMPSSRDWWLNQIHPDDRELVEEKSNKAMEAFRDILLEYRVRHKRGDYIVVHNRLHFIRNNAGKVIRIVGGVRDITERKKAEETLKENQERLELAQRVAHLGSWEFYVKEDRAVWSKAMFSIFGIKLQKEAPNIAEYSKLIHPDDLKAVAEKMDKLLTSGKLGEGLSFDYRIVEPDGSIRYLHSERLVREVDENGKAKRIVGIEQDITERMKAESAIKESEQRYHSLFSSLTEGFAYCQMIFNEEDEPVDFVYLEINDAFERQTGLQRENVVGRKVSEAIPGTREANPELIERYGKVAKTGNPERFEIFFKPISTWFDISVYSPKQGYFIAVFENITSRKEAQAELEGYAKRLEEEVEERTKQLRGAERLAAIGQTAGMVGHDIRNPLQAMISDVYLLRNELTATAECETKEGVVESLDSIENNIAYVDKIVSDLQDYTRPLTPSIKSVYLKQLLDKVLNCMRIPDNVKAEVVADEALVIQSDGDYLRRALTNLIMNAIQAMPNGGILTIDARRSNGTVRISVKDTGVGISEKDRGNLFKPLFTTKSKGQGLGLAVVKRLIEGLNGRVSFESEEGKGTKFIIEVPVSA